MSTSSISFDSVSQTSIDLNNSTITAPEPDNIEHHQAAVSHAAAAAISNTRTSSSDDKGNVGFFTKPVKSASVYSDQSIDWSEESSDEASSSPDSDSDDDEGTGFFRKPNKSTSVNSNETIDWDSDDDEGVSDNEVEYNQNDDSASRIEAAVAGTKEEPKDEPEIIPAPKVPAQGPAEQKESPKTDSGIASLDSKSNISQKSTQSWWSRIFNRDTTSNSNHESTKESAIQRLWNRVFGRSANSENAELDEEKIDCRTYYETMRAGAHYQMSPHKYSLVRYVKQPEDKELEHAEVGFVKHWNGHSIQESKEDKKITIYENHIIETESGLREETDVRGLIHRALKDITELNDHDLGEKERNVLKALNEAKKTQSKVKIDVIKGLHQYEEKQTYIGEGSSRRILATFQQAHIRVRIRTHRGENIQEQSMHFEFTHVAFEKRSDSDPNWEFDRIT